MFYKVGKLAVAGDWHGNLNWAVSVVRQISAKLADEQERLIFQLGDFGFWPEKWGEQYINGLQAVLEETGCVLFFIDGNHENHALLKKLAKKRGVEGQAVPCPVTDRITWLQRGTRFTVNDRQWLALGGAASVDRNRRTENISWFPAERIADEQVKTAIAGGPADVLLSHDSPAFTPIIFPRYPEWPPEDLALSQVNREKLERVVKECGIRYVMHGHMHMAFEITVPIIVPDDLPEHITDVRVNCFNRDGAYGNWGILDAETMEWVDGT